MDPELQRHLLMKAHRGLTLIELLIVVAIIGVSMALAVPGIRTWSANNQTRTVAGSLQTTLRQAQAEAVRSSQDVVFFRTNSSDCSTAAEAAADGSRWVIRTLALGNRAAQVVQCGAIREGQSTVTITGPTAVCFGPHGRPIVLTAAQTAVKAACSAGTNGRIVYGFSNVGNASDMKNLQVWLTLGGSVRMCDKDRKVSANMPDGCPDTGVSPTT